MRSILLQSADYQLRLDPVIAAVSMSSKNKSDKILALTALQLLLQHQSPNLPEIISAKPSGRTTKVLKLITSVLHFHAYKRSPKA